MQRVDRRVGLAAEVTNELESVLTAVVTAADGIADGGVVDTWRLQRELGALEDALTSALALVRRLGGLSPHTSVARLTREELAAAWAGPSLSPSLPAGRWSPGQSES